MSKPDKIKKTIIWRDIDFAAELAIEPDGVIVEVVVLEMSFSPEDGPDEPPSYRHMTGGATCDREQASVFIDGTIRFDGCSNWSRPEPHDRYCWHFCEPKEAENVGVMFGRVYDAAGEMLCEHGNGCDFWEDEEESVEKEASA